MGATEAAGRDAARSDAAGVVAATDGTADSSPIVVGAAAAAVDASVDPFEPPAAAPVVAAPAVVVVAGIGWIVRYVLSQIIRFGAYHHFVKNVLN